MDSILKDDNYYMEKAFAEALKAYNKDEVPIGAVLVSPFGEIIAKSHNTSEYGKSALEHAEIKVMSKAAQKLKQARLWDCTLYVTIEPCTMCATAISMMRIKRVVFGAQNNKGGAIINGIKFFESPSCFHKPNVTSGIKEDECSQLLKDFFKKKRQNTKKKY